MLDRSPDSLQQRVANKLYEGCRSGSLEVAGFPDYKPLLTALQQTAPEETQSNYQVTVKRHDRLLVLSSIAQKFLSSDEYGHEANQLIASHNDAFNADGDFLAEVETTRTHRKHRDSWLKSLEIHNVYNTTFIQSLTFLLYYFVVSMPLTMAQTTKYSRPCMVTAWPQQDRQWWRQWPSSQAHQAWDDWNRCWDRCGEFEFPATWQSGILTCRFSIQGFNQEIRIHAFFWGKTCKQLLGGKTMPMNLLPSNFEAENGDQQHGRAGYRWHRFHTVPGFQVPQSISPVSRDASCPSNRCLFELSPTGPSSLSPTRLSSLSPAGPSSLMLLLAQV